MQETNQNDVFNEPPRTLPGMLNVLTILTFIGCGLAYIGGIYSFLTNTPEKISELKDLQDKAGDNEFAGKMVQSSIDIMEKSIQYRWILLAATLVFTTMCLIGALRMRKLRKSGYPIYVIGEIAPILLSAILIGASFLGSFMVIFSCIFAILFVILYTTQRKYLVNP